MQKRRAGDGSPVHDRTAAVGAAALGWINFVQSESSLEQPRIRTQMHTKTCKVAAMKRHHRRVGQRVALLREQLQNRVLARGFATIGLQNESEWGESIV